jgi:hypothetical protein
MQINQLPYMGKQKCNVMEVGQLGDLWCLRHLAYVVKCAECGSWFHSTRPHTLYCSGACRQKAYRRRRSMDRVNMPPPF